MASYETRFPDKTIVANLTDEEATRLGYKEYFIGGTYNGGNTLNFNIGEGSASSVEGVLIPYQTQDGNWRLRFTIGFNTSGTSGTFAFGFSGLTASPPVVDYQSVSAASFAGAAAVGQCLWRQDVGYNSGQQMFMEPSAGDINSGVQVFGDVDLGAGPTSKPIWAY